MEPKVIIRTAGTDLAMLDQMAGYIKNCEWIGEGDVEDSDGNEADFLYTISIPNFGTFKVNGAWLEHM